jgi:transcriptional regulator with XRE-family HTH domain
MDLGLTQKALAATLGVDQSTLLNWEKGKASPVMRNLPTVFRFRGVSPLPQGSTLRDRLKARRTALGLSQQALAKVLGMNECSVQYIERGRRPGSRKFRDRIEEWLRSEELDR